MTNNKKTANASRHSAPGCPVCGSVMRLRWRLPDPNAPECDLRQFTCRCGVQMGDQVLREPERPAVA